MQAGPWNWLEAAKLFASLLIPIAVAAFGVYVHRVTKRFEHLQWRSQKLIEKRLAVYDDLAPLLNDLLCYFTYIGSWRELDPPDVVVLKRTVDKKVHLAAPLFSGEFFAASMEFQSLCFETYTGWGRDALLRPAFLRRREGRVNDWKQEWEACFSVKVVEPNDIPVSRKTPESHQFRFPALPRTRKRKARDARRCSTSHITRPLTCSEPADPGSTRLADQLAASASSSLSTTASSSMVLRIR